MQKNSNGERRMLHSFDVTLDNFIVHQGIRDLGRLKQVLLEFLANEEQDTLVIRKRGDAG